MTATIEWRHGEPLPEKRPRTLSELTARCVAAGDEIVLIDGERRFSWRDLDELSARLAGHWRNLVAPGERVAIVLPNCWLHLVAELAAWRLGAIAAPIGDGHDAERTRQCLAAVDPVVVVDRSALEETIRVAEKSAPGADRTVGTDTPALILFTSGSTGRPHAVVLSHDNLCSQQAAFAQLWPEIGPGDRIAGYLPWHHSFGGLAERLWALSRRACLTVVPGGGRDREQFARTLATVQPTVFMSVPKMHAVATAENLLATDRLRWAFNAGASLPEKISQWYAEHGIPLYEGWGLTETSPSAVITPPGLPRVAGVVGQPIPGVSVGVRACDHRIVVRGPNVMRGYFREPEATARCLQDGVLDSGDVGEWTEHGLRLFGRSDQMVKLANGTKLATAAIESALQCERGIGHAVITADPDLIAVVEPAHGTDVQQVVDSIARFNAGRGHDRIAAVYVLLQPSSVENGQLTPSLKISRSVVLERFDAWKRSGHGPFARIKS